MELILTGAAVGLLVGWNLLPQPDFVRRGVATVWRAIKSIS